VDQPHNAASFLLTDEAGWFRLAIPVDRRSLPLGAHVVITANPLGVFHDTSLLTHSVARFFTGECLLTEIRPFTPLTRTRDVFDNRPAFFALAG